MSSRVRGNDNTATSHDLSYTLQSACSFSLDGNNELMREESNQRNEHEQSGKPSESNKCTCDPGTNATCTCTGATPVSRTPSTRSTEHTSFPCAHCRDHDNSSADPSRKPTGRSAASAYLEWIYSAYAIATGAGRENVSTGIRASNEPRNFKQADADSTDSVERCTGIPAGVTI